MKPRTFIILFGLAAAVVGSILVTRDYNRRQAALAEAANAVASHSTPQPRAVNEPAPESSTVSQPIPQPSEKSGPKSVAESAVKKTTQSADDNNTPARPASAGNAGRTKKQPEDPTARLALSLVGNDPQAEAYWIEAINNPQLAANERKDLIEDLNEDGLSDPKHPSPQDMPVILRRLDLIEALAPFAMDKVNADAFEEAYKDLLNLADLVTGGGTPVK